MSNNSSRVFTVREQLKNIYRGAKGFVLLRTSRKKRIWRLLKGMLNRLHNLYPWPIDTLLVTLNEHVRFVV